MKIFAHRGFSSRYPENSGLAFTKSFEAGADGIECDLQKTKDGFFIIFHDDNLLRMCGHFCKVSEMTLEEIKKYSLKDGQKILELNEFFSLIPSENWINLELKADTLTGEDCPEIYRSILNHFNPRQVIISSFEHSLLPYFKKNSIKTALLFGPSLKDLGPVRSLFILCRLKPDLLHIPVDIFKMYGKFLSTLFLMTASLFGCKMNFWVINTREQYEKIKKYASSVITDDPRLLSKIIGADQIK